jgi:hypothetical protein
MSQDLWINISKFLVGFFAGTCAVFVPRLVGVLAVSDMTKVNPVPASFIYLGLAFAAIIGVAVVILEFGETKKPSDTFMAALGLPALLAGALSTAASTNHIDDLAKKNQDLTTAVRGALDIKANDNPLSIVGPVPGTPTTWLEDVLGIGAAFAQSDAGAVAAKSNWSRWGVQYQEPKYAVVIESAATAEIATHRAAQLRSRIPTAQAINTSQGYKVISGVASESTAVLDAVEVKKATGITPQLVLVK